MSEGAFGLGQPSLNGKPVGTYVKGSWTIHNLDMGPGDVLEIFCGVTLTGNARIAGTVKKAARDGDDTHATRWKQEPGLWLGGHIPTGMPGGGSGVRGLGGGRLS